MTRIPKNVSLIALSSTCCHIPSPPCFDCIKEGNEVTQPDVLDCHHMLSLLLSVLRTCPTISFSLSHTLHFGLTFTFWTWDMYYLSSTLPLWTSTMDASVVALRTPSVSHLWTSLLSVLGSWHCLANTPCIALLFMLSLSFSSCASLSFVPWGL